jgi:hypothetical protein
MRVCHAQTPRGRCPLRRPAAQGAWAAVRTKDSFLQVLFSRLVCNVACRKRSGARRTDLSVQSGWCSTAGLPTLNSVGPPSNPNPDGRALPKSSASLERKQGVGLRVEHHDANVPGPDAFGTAECDGDSKTGIHTVEAFQGFGEFTTCQSAP